MYLPLSFVSYQSKMFLDFVSSRERRKSDTFSFSTLLSVVSQLDLSLSAMTDTSTSAATAAQGQPATQWAWRSSKSFGLNTGTPDFAPVSGFQPVTGTTTRTFQYSPDGSTFAAALEDTTRLVDTREATSSKVKLDLPAAKVVDLQFSPQGGYLSTWERPIKLEDGSMNKNLRIWNSNTGTELASFQCKSQEGW